MISIQMVLTDVETAASAVRNLNGYDVGGRQLRLDFADNDEIYKVPGGSFSSSSSSGPAPDSNTVASIIASSPPAQLIELLSQMKV